jgi:F420-dependent oxidoreductase-like protein
MMDTQLRVGLKIMPQQVALSDLRRFWQLADQAGFDHVWTYDHFLPVGAPEEDDVFECWSLLAAMAEATSRVRLGATVTGNTYRSPGVLAKIAVTVDHISGGRLEFGIGSAWAEREHEMFGLDFGTVGERLERLDEACTIFTRLWSGERVSVHGRYYQIDDAISRPLPVQRPHPPIWIGGRGERKTLRIVAKHADAWNVLANNIFDRAVDLADDRRLSSLLDAYCQDIGRDPGTLRRTAQFVHDDDVEATLAAVEAYAAAGFSDAIIMVVGDAPLRTAEHVAAELLPRLREIGVRQS